MLHCVIWPTRSMNIVFSHFLATLQGPPTIEDFSNFGFEEKVKAYYVKNQAIVPTLNDRPLGMLPPSCLARVRGMIQEVKDPELFLLSYSEHDTVLRTTVKKTTKFQETIDKAPYLTHTYDESSLQPRLPAYLIPVPCETQWVRDKAHPRALENNFFKHLSRRQPQDVVPENALPAPSPRKKRGREDVVVNLDAAVLSGPRMQFHLPLESPENVIAVVQKKYGELNNPDLAVPVAPIERVEDYAIHRVGRDLNYPVSNNFGTPCWAKFYPPHDVMVNQLVDCIGILTAAPFNETKAFNQDDPAFHDVPAPLAPRFHAITVEQIGEGNPLIPNDIQALEEKRDWVFQQLGDAREGLIAWMACVLGGDILAAEYMLANMIARPFKRDNENHGIGHMPLNVMGCEIYEEYVAVVPNAMETGMDGASDSHHHAHSNGTTTSYQRSRWWHSVRGRVEHILETLATKRHTVPLDKTYLENHFMAPFYHPQNDRLEAGVLQLAPGTHVVVDETSLDAALEQQFRGHLEELDEFIHFQNVYYNFSGSKLPFSVDCPPVVLSQVSSRFMLPCALQIRCDLATPPPEEVDPQTLDLWRTMIGIFRHTEWPEQSEEVLRAIEEDFVAIRDMPGNEYLTPELFAHWNTFAIASAISHGELQLTEERWTAIKSLESDRLARL